jgi:hypothetical protein
MHSTGCTAFPVSEVETVAVPAKTAAGRAAKRREVRMRIAPSVENGSPDDNRGFA